MKKFGEFYFSHPFMFSSLTAFLAVCAAFGPGITKEYIANPTEFDWFEIFALSIFFALALIPFLSLKNLLLMYIPQKSEKVRKGIKRFNIISTVIGIIYLVILGLLILPDISLSAYNEKEKMIFTIQAAAIAFSLIACIVQNYLVFSKKDTPPKFVPFIVLSVVTAVSCVLFGISNNFIMAVLPANLFFINLREFLFKRREAEAEQITEE